MQSPWRGAGGGGGERWRPPLWQRCWLQGIPDRAGSFAPLTRPAASLTICVSCLVGGEAIQWPRGRPSRRQDTSRSRSPRIPASGGRFISHIPPVGFTLSAALSTGLAENAAAAKSNPVPTGRDHFGLEPSTELARRRTLVRVSGRSRVLQPVESRVGRTRRGDRTATPWGRVSSRVAPAQQRPTVWPLGSHPVPSQILLAG
jgi:hypothetical protein